MKIAFMIQAHTEPELLNVFLDQLLDYDGSYVFVHIDSKSISMRDKILRHERVIICPESFDIKWGDESLFLNTLYLLDYAFNQEIDFDFFSLHSGQDLATRPISEFVEFLEADPQRSFIEYNRLPYRRWRYRGGLGRVQLKWPRAFIRRVPKYSVIWWLRALYVGLYELGIIKGKKLPEIDFYGGSAWFTMSRDAVSWVFQYLNNNPWFLKMFEGAFMADEIVIQTILMNSPLRDRIINDNLRYIDWSSGPEFPRTLRCSDLSEMHKPRTFFARKFSQFVDQEVIGSIIENTREGAAGRE